MLRRQIRGGCNVSERAIVFSSNICISQGTAGEEAVGV